MDANHKKTQFHLNALAAILLRPFSRFFATSAKGGGLLILAAALAVVIANSSLAHLYHSLWEVPIGFSAGGYGFELDLHHWINDGLMAIFFFLVGLEIKREVLSGELSSLSGALLPVAAALGGMILPALIYTGFNLGGHGQHGWGIPMATDIAFSLGVLALLKGRVPTPLVIFLTALAIVDDLGAILVIALFYSTGVHPVPLAGALGLLALSYAFNRAGVRTTLPYVLIGIVIWLLMFRSGVHATVAGVLLAMTIPLSRKLKHGEFVSKVLGELNCVDEGCFIPRPDEAGMEQEQSVIAAIEDACHDAEAPLQHIEHHLQPWVTYAILPLFAFANAGVTLGGGKMAALALNTVTVGIIIGLFLGKQIGIFTFSFLAVKSGLARLPNGVGWRQLYGVAILGGIGFTMSLFIAALAFHGDKALLDAAKTGIIYASVISAVIGYLFLKLQTKKPVPPYAQPPE